MPRRDGTWARSAEMFYWGVNLSNVSFLADLVRGALVIDLGPGCLFFEIRH